MRTQLLAWGTGRRADLPWRRRNDPWAVLVSEFMLQQTQSARVAPRFEQFIERYPTVAACAAASVADLLRLWVGLGYNRRAVQLHRAAQAIVERHAGEVPSDLDDLLALPGVGPYTARAVASLAFGQRWGVLDTNAARVLARAAAGRALKAKEAQALADAMVPEDARGWNQAVMDLGATVCVRRRPRCDACPVVDACAWALAGWGEPDPADGTAGASGRQAAFVGSDRQGRGRLVAAMRAGALAVADVPTAAGWPDDPARAERVAAGLVADGLAERRGATFTLPS